MTNNEIIFENVRASFPPAQLAELVQAAYTAEQIAARRANVAITVDEGSADTAEDIFTAMLAADQFHTFAEWKRMGYSVKKGAKSAITCRISTWQSPICSTPCRWRSPSVDPAQADTLAGLHRAKQPSPRSKTQNKIRRNTR